MVFKSGFYLVWLMRYKVIEGLIGKMPIKLHKNEFNIFFIQNDQFKKNVPTHLTKFITWKMYNLPFEI